MISDARRPGVGETAAGPAWARHRLPDPGRSPVLLVDDRPENLLALEAVLEPLGEPIVKATSGRDALRVLLKEDVAVILLDVQMPELDGFETAAHIKQRERTRHIPIIFLTAISGEAHHVLEGYSQGAVDYITKPFEPTVLRSKVGVFIELHQARRRLQVQAELVARQLADQERADAALRATAADLARSNAELDQFAAIVSHDLSAPLRTTAGLLGVLAEDFGPALGPAGADLIARGQRNLEGMRRLIDGLLSWSQASQPPLSLGPVDLDRVVRDVVESLATAVEGIGGSVEVAALPRVRGDEARLAEVFQNLVGNALKFGRPSERPHVWVSAVEGDETWVVRVADDGIGVAPERRRAVFDMFSRSHDREGTGIGLAVCLRVVERLGGRIWLEERPGGGTVACVELPRA